MIAETPVAGTSTHHPYLTNSIGLGLIEFSRRQVANPTDISSVEGPTERRRAMKRAGGARPRTCTADPSQRVRRRSSVASAWSPAQRIAAGGSA